MPQAMRHLFAVILVHGDAANVVDLWRQFAASMSHDFQRRDTRLSEEEAEALALRDLAVKLQVMGGSGPADFGLPQPDLPQEGLPDPDAVVDRQEQEIFVRERLSLLTAEQRAVYDVSSVTVCCLKCRIHLIFFAFLLHQAVSADVAAGNGGQHFVDAPGGTGKTFLLQLLLATVRSQGEVAMAVASSGIAATLLPGGQTAHSRSVVMMILLELSRMCSRISTNITTVSLSPSQVSNSRVDGATGRGLLLSWQAE